MAGIDRVTELEGELAAARATVDALASRLSDLGSATEPVAFAIQKTIAHLENLIRQRDDSLAELTTFRRACFDDSPMASLLVDGAGHIVDVNVTALALFRLPRCELVGMPLSKVIEPASCAALTGLLWSGFHGEGRSELALHGGERVLFSITRLDSGGTLLALRDRSPGLFWQAESDHHRRLAHLAQLSSSVAHQINNPLAVVQGRIELLLRGGLGDRAAAERQLQVISDHCRRIGQVAQNLQAIGRPQRHPRSRMRLAPILEAAVKESSFLAPREAVDISVEPSDLEAEIDAARLSIAVQQIVAFLGMVGARGRSIRVSATRVEGDDEAELVFLVDGPALPAAVVEELGAQAPPSGVGLEPSATLALTLGWGLVREMGGWLKAVPSPSGPRLRFGIRRALVAPATVGPQQGPMRILVVDDETMLAETVSWMLAEAGHRIVAVPSAEEALARLQNDFYDFILADLLLPGLNGEDLLSQIALRWPRLAGRGVLTSGSHHSPRAGLRYLQKPFTREQLLAAL